MKPEMKIISVGATLCIVGAILLDCQVMATGYTLICLGACAIIFGPLATTL